METGKVYSLKLLPSDVKKIDTLASARGITRSKWMEMAFIKFAAESGMQLTGTSEQGRPSVFKSNLYRDRYQLVAKMEDDELVVQEFSKDTAPQKIWRTLRADTPAPVEIYLDAATDWSKFEDMDLRTALFLEVSAWWSEQD